MTQWTLLYLNLVVELCASSRSVIMWSVQKLFAPCIGQGNTELV